LYLPGGSPAGVLAYLGFKDGVLEFNGPGTWITILSDQVVLRPGGFDGRQWLLHWDTELGPASALLQGRGDMRMMLEMAPPKLAGQIEAALGARSESQGRWRFIAWVLVVLVALGLLYWLAMGG